MLGALPPIRIAIFLAIVLVPLGIAAWLGLKVARDEQKMGQHQFQALLQGRLGDVNGTINRSVQDAERHLLERVISADRVNTKSFGASETEVLRQLRRKEPLVREIFVVDARGELRFPPAGTSGGNATGDETGDATGGDGAEAIESDASADEKAFRERTAAIWRGQAVLYEPPTPEVGSGGGGSAARPRPDQARPSAARKAPGTMVTDLQIRGDTVLTLAQAHEHGWIAWYWEEGLHLLLWRRAAAGGVIGVEVDRVVLLSRIVGKLPASAIDDGRVMLLDSRGNPIHQWGSYQPAEGATPMVTEAVGYPLHSWRLAHYVSPSQERAVFGQTLRLNLILGLAAVALGLIAMAFLFYRDYARRMRDAAQRVNFVTQVSHELKTPLTNIRLYAELLESNLDEEDDKARHRAEVIIAESQRLTRLINNILTFSKQRRQAVESSPSWIDLDAVVADVMEQFKPALAARGIDVEMTIGAGMQVHADPDAVGQIVANLISNVEKYASEGKLVEVTTGPRAGDGSEDAGAYVRVADRGPGIPPGHRDKVFRPFYRASDKLADGVTGTGIGLAIARDLADRNQAELRLVDRDEGACFELLFNECRSGPDDG